MISLSHYCRHILKWCLRTMLFCHTDTRLQQSNEVTRHFQDSETEESWNHRMSHLEGTMPVIYSNLHILFLGKHEKFHGSDCDISRTLWIIFREEVLLFIQSVCSEHLLWVNCCATVLEMQQWLRQRAPAQSLLGGLTQNTCTSLLTLQALPRALLDLVLTTTFRYRYD